MKRFRMLALFLLCLVGLVVVLAKMLAYVVTGNERLFCEIAVALDRSGNVAMNGNWWETISGRSGRKWPRAKRFVNALFQDPTHCDAATLSDLFKLQLALEQARDEIVTVHA